MFEKLKNKKWCRIAYFNIAFYAAIMWFWGLTLATKKLEEIFNFVEITININNQK
jgi:hypothetical protein